MNPRAVAVEYQDDYTLLIRFSNNEVGQFDLKGYLKYPIYEPLQDEAFCKKVTVVDGVLQWNDYIDLDPDLVYLESKRKPI
ncbi:MAG: DUF2442 domain-containing protein [Chitinophagaceae bacterium]|nr:DUF2442 domain-containing protein [Chitinophagaceae bacterium]